MNRPANTTQRRSPAIKPHWLGDLDADDQRLALVQALEREAGNCSRAAKHLDMSRMTLWRWLRNLGMLTLPAEIEDRAARRFRLVG
jgi:transcriptional regulator of acetoin/glycerol metabolism